MCKLHGIRFIKGIKIFESMLKNQNLSSLLTKQLRVGFQHQLNRSILLTKKNAN